ncbi:MAG: LLM class flavin-dependent oxidoreductase, partial [Rhodospirillaceae bacterium]|nr:LLM class flavin-dependent oxidoreductase [Rhodospirillaceae bacterium]
MPIEITGLVHHNAGSMIAPRKVSEFDLSAIAQSAKIQEDAGFDRVLIANAAIMPDSMSIATFVAASTTRLKLMIAHRPGFIAPTMAARMLATIDQISRGRASVHIIAGASDAELRADGDYLTKEQRYYRCQEYIGILRKIWSSATPVTHEGVHYKFEKAFAEVKPVNGVSIPVFWGGSSDTAVDIGVQSADIYALTGDALAGTREMV